MDINFDVRAIWRLNHSDKRLNTRGTTGPHILSANEDQR